MGIMFATSFIYYAPFLLVGQFGFNFFLNGAILDVAELITYFLTVSLIPSFKRKKLFFTTASITFVSALAMLFLNQGGAICTGNHCWGAAQIAALVMMFVMKFSGAIQFIVISVYICEMYPTQIAAIGLGISCMILCTPGIFIPSLVNFLNSVGFPVMAIFCLMAIVFMIILSTMRETCGEHPPAVIKEFS
jgi:hypothetical protein